MKDSSDNETNHSSVNLGIKKPLGCLSPLGQTFISPKFISPLGARAIARRDNVFTSNNEHFVQQQSNLLTNISDRHTSAVNSPSVASPTTNNSSIRLKPQANQNPLADSSQNVESNTQLQRQTQQTNTAFPLSAPISEHQEHPDSEVIQQQTEHIVKEDSIAGNSSNSNSSENRSNKADNIRAVKQTNISRKIDSSLENSGDIAVPKSASNKLSSFTQPNESVETANSIPSSSPISTNSIQRKPAISKAEIDLDSNSTPPQQAPALPEPTNYNASDLPIQREIDPQFLNEANSSNTTNSTPSSKSIAAYNQIQRQEDSAPTPSENSSSKQTNSSQIKVQRQPAESLANSSKETSKDSKTKNIPAPIQRETEESQAIASQSTNSSISNTAPKVQTQSIDSSDLAQSNISPSIQREAVVPTSTQSKVGDSKAIAPQSTNSSISNTAPSVQTQSIDLSKKVQSDSSSSIQREAIVPTSVQSRAADSREIAPQSANTSVSNTTPEVQTQRIDRSNLPQSSTLPSIQREAVVPTSVQPKASDSKAIAPQSTNSSTSNTAPSVQTQSIDSIDEVKLNSSESQKVQREAISSAPVQSEVGNSPAISEDNSSLTASSSIQKANIDSSKTNSVSQLKNSNSSNLSDFNPNAFPQVQRNIQNSTPAPSNNSSIDQIIDKPNNASSDIPQIQQQSDSLSARSASTKNQQQSSYSASSKIPDKIASSSQDIAKAKSDTFQSNISQPEIQRDIISSPTEDKSGNSNSPIKQANSISDTSSSAVRAKEINPSPNLHRKPVSDAIANDSNSSTQIQRDVVSDEPSQPNTVNSIPTAGEVTDASSSQIQRDSFRSTQISQPNEIASENQRSLTSDTTSNIQKKPDYDVSQTKPSQPQTSNNSQIQRLSEKPIESTGSQLEANGSIQKANIPSTPNNSNSYSTINQASIDNIKVQRQLESIQIQPKSLTDAVSTDKSVSSNKDSSNSEIKSQLTQSSPSEIRDVSKDALQLAGDDSLFSASSPQVSSHSKDSPAITNQIHRAIVEGDSLSSQVKKDSSTASNISPQVQQSSIDSPITSVSSSESEENQIQREAITEKVRSNGEGSGANTNKNSVSITSANLQKQEKFQFHTPKHKVESTSDSKNLVDRIQTDSLFTKSTPSKVVNRDAIALGQTNNLASDSTVKIQAKGLDNQSISDSTSKTAVQRDTNLSSSNKPKADNFQTNLTNFKSLKSNVIPEIQTETKSDRAVSNTESKVQAKTDLKQNNLATRVSQSNSTTPTPSTSLDVPVSNSDTKVQRESAGDRILSEKTVAQSDSQPQNVSDRIQRDILSPTSSKVDSFNSSNQDLGSTNSSYVQREISQPVDSKISEPKESLSNNAPNVKTQDLDSPSVLSDVAQTEIQRDAISADYIESKTNNSKAISSGNSTITDNSKTSLKSGNSAAIKTEKIHLTPAIQSHIPLPQVQKETADNFSSSAAKTELEQNIPTSNISQAKNAKASSSHKDYISDSNPKLQRDLDSDGVINEVIPTQNINTRTTASNSNSQLDNLSSQIQRETISPASSELEVSNLDLGNSSSVSNNSPSIQRQEFDVSAKQEISEPFNYQTSSSEKNSIQAQHIDRKSILPDPIETKIQLKTNLPKPTVNLKLSDNPVNKDIKEKIVGDSPLTKIKTKSISPTPIQSKITNSPDRTSNNLDTSTFNNSPNIQAQHFNDRSTISDVSNSETISRSNALPEVQTKQLNLNEITQASFSERPHDSDSSATAAKNLAESGADTSGLSVQRQTYETDTNQKNIISLKGDRTVSELLQRKTSDRIKPAIQRLGIIEPLNNYQNKNQSAIQPSRYSPTLNKSQDKSQASTPNLISNTKKSIQRKSDRQVTNAPDSWSSISDLMAKTNHTQPQIQTKPGDRANVQSSDSEFKSKKTEAAENWTVQKSAFLPPGVWQSEEGATSLSFMGQPQNVSAKARENIEARTKLKEAASNLSGKKLPPIKSQEIRGDGIENIAQVTVQTSTDNTETTSDETNDAQHAQSVDILAREIYGLLRQQLEIERERQGGSYRRFG